MSLTTRATTRLNSAVDLSRRTTIPQGETLTILTQIYGGKVLKVSWGGEEWYTANPDWTPPEVTESACRPPPEPVTVKLPWDRPQKRGRGRPRKER